MPDIGERSENVDSELKRVRSCLEGTDVSKVIVFGSVARNNIHSQSDIDLLIIKPTAKPFMERLHWAYATLQPRIAMDIVVYTPEEVERLRNNNPFLKRALTEGRVILEQAPTKQ